MQNSRFISADLAAFVAALREIFSQRRRNLNNQMLTAPLRPYGELTELHARYQAFIEAEAAVGEALRQLSRDIDDSH